MPNRPSLPVEGRITLCSLGCWLAAACIIRLFLPVRSRVCALCAVACVFFLFPLIWPKYIIALIAFEGWLANLISPLRSFQAAIYLLFFVLNLFLFNLSQFALSIYWLLEARACVELHLYEEAITWCDKGLTLSFNDMLQPLTMC